MTTTPRSTFRSTPRSSRTRRAAVAITTTLLLLTTACGVRADSADGTTGTPTTESTTAANGGSATADGTLFDASTVHDIEVSFDTDDFDEMVATYESTGDKDWIEATVTIDGVTHERVGLRLKGNSSLRGVSSSSAEELPWLIRFDKYVDGETHEGHHAIVVRSNTSSTSLNEAVALDLLDEAGLAAVTSTEVRFSVNGSDDVLRLVVELPEDPGWYETVFDGDGALYKAKGTGDWSYRGEDLDAYAEAFTQKSGEDLTDLEPLVEFLRFLDESDDATFAAELPERLDVDAFATYLAMMDLLDNFDDISGPGNNSYLWWDAETERFTVVPWDLNLAFGTSMGGGRGGAPGGGGPGRGGFGGAPPEFDGERPEGMPAFGGEGPAGMSEFGGEGPAGMPDRNGSASGTSVEGADRTGRPGTTTTGEADRTDDTTTPADDTTTDARRGPGRSGSNPLVDRFHANETFEALYQEKLAELRVQLVDGGTAEEIVSTWTDVLTNEATDLVDEATIRSEADAIITALTR